MARAWTLAASEVVIWRCCTGETRPCGNRMKMSVAPAPGEGLDGRAAGVARSRADDRGAAAALGQDMVHQPGQKLHGHILEGQRRPVEELQHEFVGCGSGPAGTRPRGGRWRRPHATMRAKTRVGDLARHERRQQPYRHLRIAKAAQRADIVCARAAATRPARRGRRRAPVLRAATSQKPSSGASPRVLTYLMLARSLPPPCVRALHRPLKNRILSVAF